MAGKTIFKKENILIEIFLLIGFLIWIVPVIAAVSTSLRVKGVGNYIMVLTTHIDNILIFPRMFLNSTIITITTLALIISSAILAGYAFSKLRFRGRKVLYLILLGCFAIPMISTLIPNSILITKVGLRGTYFSMIMLLVAVNFPLALMIFKNNFDGLPNAFLEAATIDGSSNFNSLIKIVIPISVPAIVNVLVVMFIQVWNDFQIPLIFATENRLYPLTLAPSFFGASQNKIELPPLYASIILIAIPVVLFYLFMQDKIIKGMSLGGLKE